MNQSIAKRLEQLEAGQVSTGPDYNLLRVHRNAESIDPTIPGNHERPGTDEFTVNQAGESRVISKEEFDRLIPGARFVFTRLVLAAHPNAEPLDDDHISHGGHHA